MLHPRFLLLTLLTLLIATSLATSCSAQASGGRVTVAAAADLKAPLGELGQAFEKKTGTKVEASFGASGSLFAQISNGAPFDVFMSADTDYPTKLAGAGQALGETIRVYARGTLVLWMSKDWVAKAGKAHAKLDLPLLLDDSVTHIAIANPQHAPYGRAAEAALRKSNLLDRLRPKIVTAENVAQASQFVYSGSSDAGLVALTSVLANKDAGGRWEKVPLDLYPPIDQAAVVTRYGQGNNAARAFIEFVTSAEGKAVLSKYGFGAPSK